MLKICPLLVIFCFISECLNAQLVSWRDLVDGDLPLPDERIRYGADSLHFGDLWLPENGDAQATVILFHGGCWLDIYPGVEIMNHMANALRDAGFAVWNVEYRRLGHHGGGYPGTFLDAADGADHLLELGEQYRLPLNRIIAAGHSAGGHLATWLAGRKNIREESALYSGSPVEIDGVISLAGINDLQRYALYGASPCGERTVERLVDLDNRGDVAYLDTSPVNLLPLGVPFMGVSAAFDAPVPPFFGYHFTNSAKEAGDDSSLILQTEAGHFEMIAPWSDEWQEVLQLFKSIAE